ncbi:hypothetical protein [Acidithiobacillus concretivorus]|uniref:DUF2897 domain-containing protein n=1 Tax=Acidithiobacillus concretivorus TaxID=3063952 RepID=A0ABS5ZPZ4_9PROT|nr:hypothetical protein [Acidithiobacillus concretivorus]MBU2738718.1 hypothetical protein [Acidithiobacillus concretivorus]
MNDILFWQLMTLALLVSVGVPIVFIAIRSAKMDAHEHKEGQPKKHRSA